MKKSLLLLLFLLAGITLIGAENAKIKGDGCGVEFLKDKVFITNGSNQRLVLIGKLLYSWTRPVLTATGAEVGEDGSMKVTYRVSIKDDAKATPEQTAAITADAESIKLEALWKVEGNKITVTYTLTSPKVKPDGAMVEIVGHSGATKQPLAEGNIRPFANKTDVVQVKLPGNPKWSSTWAEHAGFKKSGDVYTSVFEFTVAPAAQ